MKIYNTQNEEVGTVTIKGETWVRVILAGNPQAHDEICSIPKNARRHEPVEFYMTTDPRGQIPKGKSRPQGNPGPSPILVREKEWIKVLERRLKGMMQ